MIHYEVIGRDGKIDLEKTFDVAEYWKDYIQYDELKLDHMIQLIQMEVLCIYWIVDLLLFLNHFEVSFKNESKLSIIISYKVEENLVEILESDD